ncbi:MAG: hypothetical protein CMJ58_03725 [Planctomycetaceae bacterium]|nr:hypothetical protein [Planctomycetaceae bacterium]
MPNWPLQRLAIKQPELTAAPVALYAPSRRGQAITACCAAATAAGLRPDMPLAEATVLLEAAARAPGKSRVADSLRESSRVAGDVAQRSPQLRRSGNSLRSPPVTPAFHLLPHDQAADRTALEKLAQWCHRFSPSVGWEMAEGAQQGNAPDALLLDGTKLGPLFGGEAAWAAAVAAGLQRLGLHARIAVADTPAAALAVVKFPIKPRPLVAETPANEYRVAGDERSEPPERRNWGLRCAASPATPFPPPAIIPPGDSRTALAPLPPAALRLSPPLVETLQHLGIGCVGQLLALPRDQLQTRLGPEVLWRVDQAMGRSDEPLHTVPAPPQATAERLLEFPLADRGLIEQIVGQLIDQLAWQLARRSAGALAVTCRLECVEAPPAEFTAGLYQPTADPRQIGEVIAMHLERLRLPGPVEAAAVTAARTARLGEQQRSLFDGQERPHKSPQLAGLVNRLTSRLGAGQVVRYRLQRDPQPEHAFRREPLIDTPPSGHAQPATRKPPSRRRAAPAPLLASSATTTPAPPTAAPLDRPWQVLAAPQPLEVLAIAPEGPPARFRFAGEDHQIVRHWGPERIETGWQRRRMIRRDYYRVETATGVRAWLFRRRGDGAWFLHGWFD